VTANVSDKSLVTNQTKMSCMDFSPYAEINPRLDATEADRLFTLHDLNIHATYGYGGFTLLHFNRNVELVRNFLDKGFAVDTRGPRMMTALHCACQVGDVVVAGVLIDAGASVVAVAEDGRTPMQCAVLFGHSEVVKLLLERGAPVSAEPFPWQPSVPGQPSPPKWTMLQFCVAQQHPKYLQTAQLLLEHDYGAQVFTKDEHGHSLLGIAAYSTQYRMEYLDAEQQAVVRANYAEAVRLVTHWEVAGRLKVLISAHGRVGNHSQAQYLPSEMFRELRGFWV
jgi:ankyrin repeat protein